MGPPSLAASQNGMIAAKRPTWPAKLALAIIVTLLALGLLEIAVRIFAHATARDRLIVIDDLVGWKLAPNAHRRYDKESQPYFIAINSKGLRDVEHAYEKPPGVLRIVVIGDSFVFGAGGVEQSKRFSDLLQAATKNVEVINMGVPAYGTDQEYLYLATEGLKYHPDIVLLCAYYNDFSESFSTLNPSNGRPKGYISLNGGQLMIHPAEFSLFYRLAQHSYLMGVAQLELSKVSRVYDRAMRRGHGVLTHDERLATFKQLFVAADEVCRRHGAAFVLVYLPFQRQFKPWLIQQVMDELAATHGMRTLDLMEPMKLENRVTPSYLPNDIHFNEHGHEVVARELLKYLTGSGLLKPESVKVQ